MVSGTHRHLIDYLGDEVMDGLDAGLRELLSAAAVAERFTAALLAAMTGSDDAAARWTGRSARTCSSRRSTARAAGSGCTGCSPTTSGRGCRRTSAGGSTRLAAAWLDAAGMGREAMAHAFEADDPVLAARLVGREGRAAFEAGEVRTLERWIAALPPDTRESDLEIAWLEGWCRFYTGDLAGGAAIAARATGAPGDRSAAPGGCSSCSR